MTALLTVSCYYLILIGKVRPKIQTLLDSLTELSELLYLPAQSRSPNLVLRLHNQAFIHAMTCKEVIGQPKSLTSRKFYGRYWHSLTAHAGKQSRIISAKSTNTEEEERPSILCKVSPDWPAGDLVTSSPQAWSAFKQNRNLRKLNKAMLLKCRNHRFRNTTALYHHSPTQQYLIALSSITPRSIKPIYKASVTSLPVAKVSGDARSCLEWNSWMALMSQVLDPRDQSFTTSGQVIFKKKNNTLSSAGGNAWMMMLLLSHTGSLDCTTKKVTVPESYAEIFYTGRMMKMMQTVHKIRKVQMQMMQQIWNAREII